MIRFFQTTFVWNNLQIRAHLIPEDKETVNQPRQD